jgi:hypothetical protein
LTLMTNSSFDGMHRKRWPRSSSDRGSDIVAESIDRGNSMSGRQRDNLFSRRAKT